MTDVASQEILAAVVQNAVIIPATGLLSNEIITATQQNRVGAETVGNGPLATIQQNLIDTATVQNQIVISAAVVDDATDPSLLLVICDELGQPILDGTGQYIIAG